jgi:hypothetical protein
MLIEALRSRPIDKPQKGQLCVLSDRSFSTNIPQFEHIFEVFLGSTRRLKKLTGRLKEINKNQQEDKE